MGAHRAPVEKKQWQRRDNGKGPVERDVRRGEIEGCLNPHLPLDSCLHCRAKDALDEVEATYNYCAPRDWFSLFRGRDLSERFDRSSCRMSDRPTTIKHVCIERHETVPLCYVLIPTARYPGLFQEQLTSCPPVSHPAHLRAAACGQTNGYGDPGRDSRSVIARFQLEGPKSNRSAVKFILGVLQNLALCAGLIYQVGYNRWGQRND